MKIQKCKICGEPYYLKINGRVGDENACDKCNEKAKYNSGFKK